VLFTLACSARADLAGPVVGFERIEVNPGPQWVAPTVYPFAPQTDEGETTGQVLNVYLGDEFQSSTNVYSADWVGFGADQNGTGQVSMVWRDDQQQWRDLEGDDAEPDPTGALGLWLDLVFDPDESINPQTRELVLSGQVIW
jgi:hypothetical protein